MLGYNFVEIFFSVLMPVLFLAIFIRINIETSSNPIMKKIRIKLLPTSIKMEESDIGEFNPIDSDDDHGDTDAYIDLQKMGFAYLKIYYQHGFVTETKGIHFKEGIVAMVNHDNYTISFDIFAMLQDGRCIMVTTNKKQQNMQFNGHKIIITCYRVPMACQELLNDLLCYNQPHQQLTPDNFAQIYKDFCNQRNQYLKDNN